MVTWLFGIPAILRTWVANYQLRGQTPRPNAVVRDLIDLAAGNPALFWKVPLARCKTDAQLLTSVLHPQTGAYISVTHGIVREGNHRRFELVRRASDPNSSITWDTSIFIHFVGHRQPLNLEYTR
jgi:hypothetical protein